MWKAVSRIILRYRISLLILVGAVAIFFGYFGAKVEKSQEFARVVPTTDSDFQNYMSFKASFGEDGNTLVIGLKHDSLFTPERLNAMLRFCKWAKKQDGVQEVLSMVTLYDLTVDDSTRTFALKPLLADAVQSEAQARRFYRNIKRQRFYEGLLLSKDEHATIIAITITPEASTSKQKHKLVNDIRAQADSIGAAHGMEVHMVGLPYIRSYMSTQIAKELNYFMAGAILLTALALFVFYRSLYAVVFPLLLLGVSSLVTVGLVGILGFKLNILSALLPPIIVILGIPPCIYILGEYYEEYRRTRHKRLAITKTIRKLGIVTLMINVTTAMGFFTLSFTQVRILQEFGLVAFLATMLSYFFTMIIIPGVFSMLPPPSEKNLRYLDAPLINRLTLFAGRLVRNRAGMIYGITLVIVGIALFGLFQLKAVSYMVDDLPEEDTIRSDMKFLEGEFKGVMPFEIVINTGKKNGLRKTRNLKKIAALQDSLMRHPELSRSLSIADVMKWSRQSFMGGDRSQYMLPAREELSFIAEYADNTRLQNKRLGQTGQTQDILSTLVDSSYQVARITGFVQDIGSEHMPELIARVEADVQAVFGTEISLRAGDPEAGNPSLLANELQYFITGTTNIFLKANEYLIKNLFWSLLATFSLVGIQMFFLFNSARIMVLSLITNLVPLLVTAGIMGLLGIPLKPSTALIYQLAFGIAIDDSIHFLAMYRMRRKSGLNIRDAVNESLRTTGMSIIYTSTVLFAGFVIFSQSKFGSTQALGILTSVTLLIAMFSNLLLLPTLLIRFDKANKPPKPALIDPPTDEEVEEDDRRDNPPIQGQPAGA